MVALLVLVVRAWCGVCRLKLISARRQRVVSPPRRGRKCVEVCLLPERKRGSWWQCCGVMPKRGVLGPPPPPSLLCCCSQDSIFWCRSFHAGGKLGPFSPSNFPLPTHTLVHLLQQPYVTFFYVRVLKREEGAKISLICRYDAHTLTLTWRW